MTVRALIAPIATDMRGAFRLAARPILAFMLVGVFWGAYSASIPEIKAQLGLGDAAFGFLLLAQGLGLVSAMWFAPRADRALGAAGLPVGTIVFAAFFLVPPLVVAPLWYALGLVALGAASGLVDVLMNARVSEIEARARRSLMNVSHAMFSLAYALSALATGLVRDAGLPLWLPFAGAMVLAAAIAGALRLAPDAGEDDGAEAGTGFPWRLVLLCGAIVLVAFMSEASVETWAALHVERTLGGDALDGALGPTILGLTMAAGRLSGQVLSDRVDDAVVIRWAAALAAAGALVAAAAPAPGIAYLGFALLGLGVSVIGPLGLALTGRLVAPRHRTAAIGRAAVMGFAGFFLAPLVMGLLSGAFGLRAAFAGIAVVALLALPLLWALRRAARG
ncbi:MAG: MFS transporter [Shimia sp.]